MGYVKVVSFLALCALTLYASTMAERAIICLPGYQAVDFKLQLPFHLKEFDVIFDIVNLARAISCRLLRLLYLCCFYLVLKETPVEPINSLYLTAVLYTLFKRHLRLNEQFILFLQLHVLIILN